MLDHSDIDMLVSSGVIDESQAAALRRLVTQRDDKEAAFWHRLAPGEVPSRRAALDEQ